MSAYPAGYRERPRQPLVCVECMDGVPLYPAYADERCGDTLCQFHAEQYDDRFVDVASDEDCERKDAA